MQAASPLLSLSPSFNGYSSNKLAEIAARVVQEFSQESEFDEFHAENEQNFDKSEEDVNDDEGDEEEEEEFEFSFVGKDSQMSPISADEIFYNGQIRPVFPLFDTSLLLSECNHQTIETHELNPSPKPIRFPLRKLLFEDRDPPSSSSSEADDLEGIQPGTYCVWTPKARDDARCKKSNSTGSSKRWKFKDLLHHQRSNSDGKETFVFLTPSSSRKMKKNKEEEKPSKEEMKGENDFVKRRLLWGSY
ncbi:Protein of unknown function DUF1645, plant [Dillenia turbinata]|uniref:Uncharacterized protein n=1 Tax=Dillenia turbinata TaxID=194707 RepID=A0AAN8UU64_9MAGN